MSGKVKTIIWTIVVVALVSGIWAFIMYNKTKTITEKFEGEIAQLTATLDALGPNVDCYTVTEEFVNHVSGNTTGQVIEENALEPISVPESLVGDTYITDPSKAIGRYFKVNVQPGTPLTSDLIMAEKYDDTLRDVDVVCDNWVVGMRVGDYVDLDFTLPFGQNYTVLSHKRIQYIGTNTVKMYLTAEELDTYISVLVDHYLNQSNGTHLFFTKYVEPGVQSEATAFYSASDAVRTAMLTDPNIVSKAEIKLKAAFRPAIDSEFYKFIDENTTIKSQSQAISGGNSAYNSNVSSDYNTYAQDAAKNKQEDTYESSNDDVVLEDVEETTSDDKLEQSAAEVETTEAVEETGSVELETEATVEETTSGSTTESPAAVEEPDVVG